MGPSLWFWSYPPCPPNTQIAVGSDLSAEPRALGSGVRGSLRSYRRWRRCAGGRPRAGRLLWANQPELRLQGPPAQKSSSILLASTKAAWPPAELPSLRVGTQTARPHRPPSLSSWDDTFEREAGAVVQGEPRGLTPARGSRSRGPPGPHCTPRHEGGRQPPTSLESRPPRSRLHGQ